LGALETAMIKKLIANTWDELERRYSAGKVDQDVEMRYKWSRILGLREFLLKNIEKSCQEALALGKEENVNVVFICGMAPDSSHGGGVRSVALMKQLGLSNSVCIFPKDREIDIAPICQELESCGVRTFPLVPIASEVTDYTTVLNGISENNLVGKCVYSMWMVGAMIAYENKLNMPKVHWIYECMESISAALGGTSISSLYEQDLSSVSSKKLLGCIWWEAENLFVKEADHIIVMTLEDKERLCDMFGAVRSKICIVSTGFTFNNEDSKVFSENQSDLHKEQNNNAVKDKECNVLFVGGMRHEPNVNGIMWLLDGLSIKSNQESCFTALHLHLIGDCPEETRLLIAERYPSTYLRITFHGFVDCLTESIHRTADVCILPIISGVGIRGKLIDYVLGGKPVVTTKLGQEGYGMEDDYDCLIRDDINGFIDAIYQLVNNPTLANKLTHNASHVLHEMEWNVQIKPLADLMSPYTKSLYLGSKTTTTKAIGIGKYFDGDKPNNPSPNYKLLVGKPSNNIYNYQFSPKDEEELGFLYYEFENLKPQFRELQLFKALFHDTSNYADYLGITSRAIGNSIDDFGRFDHRIKVCMREFSPGIILYNPYPYLGYIFYNVWDEAEYWHTGITRYADNLFEAIGLGANYASSLGRTPSLVVYKNFWLAKAAIFRQISSLTVRALEVAGALGCLNSNKLAPYRSSLTGDVGKVHIAVFVIERMITTLLARNAFGEISVMSLPLSTGVDRHIPHISDDWKESTTTIINELINLSQDEGDTLISRHDFYEARRFIIPRFYARLINSSFQFCAI
jgi:glycosyltransferase involved in cell wall biosynthesis